MKELMLVGTAANRPNAIGSMYRLKPGGEWEKLTDFPDDASVQAITPHPERAEVLFAATRKGVYRSTDGGDSWTRLNVTDETIQFWTVVIHPTRPDTLFAAGGPVSVYRSDDGGDTWRKCKSDHPERFKIPFGDSRVMRIAFHPLNPDVMYAVAEINGFLVSEDGGETWRGEPEGLLALSKLPHLKSRIETDDDAEGIFDAHSVCTTPADPDALFYICRLGIFESRDKGKTFRDLEVGKFAPFSYTRDCRFVSDDPKKMYACFSISSRSNAGALYGSDDLGKSWYRADAQVAPASTMLGFGMHPTDPNGVITVTRGGQVFFTTDGCRSWTERPLPVLLALAEHPNVHVKAAGVGDYALDPYPFRSLDATLRRVFNAFGAQRIVWASELSRLHHPYRQCVTHFSETLSWLAPADRDLIMGGNLCRLLEWG